MRTSILPLAGLLLCLIALLPASAFAAGSYEVEACNAAPGGANHSWVWSSTDTSPSDHFAEHAACPYPTGSNGGKTDQESGLATTDALGLSSGAPPDTSAAWTFTAPADTTIAGLTYERFLGHEEDPDNYWVPALRADGTIVTGESCLDIVEHAESCYVGGPPGHGELPAVITGLSAHQLSYGIACVAETGTQCVTGASEHAAWAAMYGARVIINDPTTPTLTTPTGTLWESASYRKGTQTVTVEAADAGGGVQSIQLAADGKAIETYTASCDYSYPKPCPASTGPQTLSLPTSELTDGTHTITLTATDAAGVQASRSEQITVANEPPPAPADLTASSAFGSATYEVRWIDPQGQVAPVTSATYEVCHNNEAPANCSTPVTTGPEGPVTVVLPEAGTWTIVVWLTNAAGDSSPANAARLTIPIATCCSTPETHSETPASTSDTPTLIPSSPVASIPPASPVPTPSAPTPQPKLRATAVLRGRTLIIRITGPAGVVRAHYRLRDPGHHPATSKTRKAVLRDGRATISFELPKSIRAPATLRVVVESASDVLSVTVPKRKG
jgi:Bacterial Ig domain